MKTLYLDCSMGAAGDMLAGALLGLVPDPDAALGAFNAFGIPHVSFSVERMSKNGVMARRLAVSVRGEEEDCGHHHHDGGGKHAHVHRHLKDVRSVVESLAMPPRAKENVLAIYDSIAAAESRAHGVSVQEVHFHETGALDAIADISAVCWLMDAIAPDETVVSPVNTGKGFAKCAHGILPVPAPATAFLLEGAVSYCDGVVDGELTTPTGAALLRRFATSFGPRPAMKVEAVSFGCGKKDFPVANVLAASAGERAPCRAGAGQIPPAPAVAGADEDFVEEIAFNVDDMTGEGLANAAGELFRAGALDVAIVPALMKKGRPGHAVAVLCKPCDLDKVADAVFRSTSTIGARVSEKRRLVLERGRREIELPDGRRIGAKTALWRGMSKEKLEADELAALLDAARKENT